MKSSLPMNLALTVIVGGSVAAAGSVRWVDPAPVALPDDDTAGPGGWNTTVVTSDTVTAPSPERATPVVARPAPKARAQQEAPASTRTVRSVGQSSLSTRLQRGKGWEAMARGDDDASPEVVRSQLLARLDEADTDLRQAREQGPLRAERDRLSRRVTGAAEPGSLVVDVENLCRRAADLRERAEARRQ